MTHWRSKLSEFNLTLSSGEVLAVLGVALIQKSTVVSRIVFKSCHNWICGLAVSLKKRGDFPRFQKCNPETKKRARAKNVTLPPPQICLDDALICHVFIPPRQVGQCSCMGANFAYATALLDFCLRALQTKNRAYSYAQRYEIILFFQRHMLFTLSLAPSS